MKRFCLFIVFIFIVQGPLTSFFYTKTIDTIQLTLEECIQTALKENHRIKAIDHKLEAKQAEYKKAKAGMWPDLKLTNTTGAVPEARGDAVFSPDSDNDYGNLGAFNKLKLEFSQPIYAFGKFKSLYKAAQSNLAVTLAEKNSTQDEIIYIIKELYYSILLNRQIIKSLSEIRDNFKQGLEKAEQKLKANNTNVKQSDILKLKIGLAKIEMNYFKSKQGQDLAFESLKSMLNIAPNIPFDLADQNLKPEKCKINPLPFYIDTLFENNSDWKKLQAGLIAKEALQDASKKEYYPVFFIGGQFTYAVAPNRNDQTNPFVVDDFNVLQGGAALGLHWDLNFASHSAKIKIAEAEYEETLELEKAALEGMPLEVEKLYNQVLEKKEAMKFSSQSRKAGRSLLILANTNFELGLGDGKDLFESLATYTSTSSDYFLSVYEYNLALSKLSQKIGKEITQLKY